jgi:periplasmic divalent cation tolerance protein
MTGARIALTTCDSPESATALARALVERRLVACVNVVPGVRSIYRWEGEIHEDAEVLLVMKTSADRLPALTAAVQELHSYDVPELVALPVEAGSEPYLDWIAQSVT